MTGQSQKWTKVLLAAAFALVACDPGPAIEPPDDTGDGQSGIVLNRVGQGQLTLHPGEVHTLTALLQKVQVGPVPGGNVTWEIKGTGHAGAKLQESATVSDENGLASVQLQLGGTGRFGVVATSEGAGTSASWQIDVRPVEKRLKILSSGQEVIIDPNNPYLATVDTIPHRTLRLRVQVSYADNRAVVNEKVSFEFTADPGPEDTVIETLEGEGVTYTDGAGEAMAFITTGPRLEGFYVTARLENGTFAQFEFEVRDPSGSCRSNAQCPIGTVCRSGECQPRGAVGQECTPGNDASCPFGYMCNPQTGQCMSDSGNCANCADGLICDPVADACVEPDDCDTCPDGFSCVDDIAICQPDNPDEVMDLTGLWFTRHIFDVEKALPGWLASLKPFVRQINQLMNGQVSGNIPPWVANIVQALFQQFIPPWVNTIVVLLDSALTIFSDLRADGEMVLSEYTSKAVLDGDEYWGSFIFYFLPQCGGNIGGDPNNPPPCARLDIYTDDMDLGDAAVEVFPFTVRVGPGSPEAQIQVPTRQAKIALAGIIKYALDMVVYYTTGYPSLEGPPGNPQEGALYNLVDCQGIASGVQGYEIVVEALCAVAVEGVAHLIADELKNATVNADMLRFSGHATARAEAAPLRATEIGYEDFESRTPADGYWKGKFMGMGKDIPGSWRASRKPIR